VAGAAERVADRTGATAAAVAGQARRAARQARPWIDRMARVGFLAQALVYLVIGGLAVRAAGGWGRVPTDAVGALRPLVKGPFGAVPLIVIAVGAFAYATWQVVAAFSDAGGEGTSAWGLTVRAGRVIGAVLYTMLGAGAIGLLSHPEGGKGDAVRRYTTQVMEAPYGKWVVVLIGLGVLGFGVYEVADGCRGDVCARLDLSAMSRATHRWAQALGRFGNVAHGVIFGLIGGFLLRAALHTNPREAAGLGGALRTLWRGVGSPWLLGVIALGLVAYGIFQLTHACYRRVETP
jgi:Domain of Unknown Function (DUF1206)